MFYSRSSTPLTVLIAIGLMLGSSATHAFTVETDSGGTNATAIKNLEVDGAVYDVEFVEDRFSNIWPDGTQFDFSSSSAAEAAVRAATAAISSMPEIVTVGPSMEDYFRTPYDTAGFDIALTWDSAYDYLEFGPIWYVFENGWLEIESVTYARFTQVSEAPPATLKLGFDDPDTQDIDLLVADQGLYDFNDVKGIIDFCHETGPIVVCATAVSKPAEGTSSLPELSLSVDYVHLLNGSVDIMVTDTDFSIGASAAEANIEGSIEGGESVTYKFFGDTENRAFHRGQQIASFGPFDSPESEIFGDDVVPADSVGSLTLTIELRGAGNANEINGSFTSSLNLVPSDADIDVPNVVGLQQSAAESAIEDALLKVGTVDTIPSETIPLGEVISQDPSAGSSVTPGSSVNMVVSAGSDLTEVPNPAGLAGAWFDPVYDGEGYQFLVIPGDGIFLYYYGHDSSGGRLWLVSSIYTGDVAYGQSMSFNLSRASGTFSDPNPQLEEWGTLIVIFDSCIAGRLQMNGLDGSKTANIVKLVGIDDLDCDL